MKHKNLSDWLNWQENLHDKNIDLGLKRVRQVAQNLDILTLPFPLISVAGTNGKGSTVAMLDAILRNNNYQTGTYTTPHIFHYNERVALSGVPVSDVMLCEAFEEINIARGKISLTEFEFGTLAAVLIFIQQKVNIAILEVGLGGRLDAVNLWDADLAIITSIGIDHTQWLGETREAIAYEKSGIMRTNKPVVCGDLNPPKAIAAQAKQKNAILYQAGRDFSSQIIQDQYFSLSINSDKSLYPKPALIGDFQIQNAATVIMGLKLLKKVVLISNNAIKIGLQNVSIKGRLQKLQTNPEVLLDVAHNPHAVKELALFLKKKPILGKNYAIFSILADKDISKVIATMHSHIHEWHIVELEDKRALSFSEIEIAFHKRNIYSVRKYKSFQSSLKHLINTTSYQDRIVVFGSFLVVSAVISAHRTLI